MNSTVTIEFKVYNKLLEDSLFLEALMAAGVDNWDGYELAQQIMEDGEEEYV